MKRASYREGVEWIACNDSPADDEDAEQISGYISTILLSTIFHVDASRVAEDVVRFRRKFPEVAGK